MTNKNMPLSIMSDTSWSFAEGNFDSAASFSEAVRQYQIDINDADTWKPKEVVLPTQHVLLAYRCGSRMETVELASSNGSTFTALDLLFKMHDAHADKIANHDHHFFEGLKLNSMPIAGHPPVYFLRLGS